MEDKLKKFYYHKIKVFNDNKNKYNVTLLYYFLNTKTIIESLADILDLKSDRQKKYLCYLHHSKTFKNLIYQMNDNPNQINKIIAFYSKPEIKANFIFHQDYLFFKQSEEPVLTPIRKLFLILSFIQDNYKLIGLITIITIIVIYILEF